MAAWPEIAASSRAVWPLVLWRATSQVTRRMSLPGSPDGGSPDEGIEHPPVVVEEEVREP